MAASGSWLSVTWAESGGWFMWSGTLEQARWAFSLGGCRGLRGQRRQGTRYLRYILFAKANCKSGPYSRDNKENLAIASTF